MFPPGSIVEMSNSEIGVVLTIDENHRLSPRVLIVLDCNKRPKRREKIISLIESQEDEQGRPYRIKAELPAESFNIKLSEYLNKGLLVEEAFL